MNNVSQREKFNFCFFKFKIFSFFKKHLYNHKYQHFEILLIFEDFGKSCDFPLCGFPKIEGNKQTEKTKLDIISRLVHVDYVSYP